MTKIELHKTAHFFHLNRGRSVWVEMSDGRKACCWECRKCNKLMDCHYTDDYSTVLPKTRLEGRTREEVRKREHGENPA
jgi:hypothetical protein